jgi:RecA-family ATPase
MTYLQKAVVASHPQQPSYASIPTQIALLKAFVLYQLIPSDKVGGKQRKQAINPRTGKAANWNNQDDYVTLEEAKKLLDSDHRYSGIGICFKGLPTINGKHLIAIDLDDIYEAPNQFKSHHLQLLNGLHGFVETSVSGKGRHVFALANERIPDFKCHEYGVEAFSSNGFIALTGNEDSQFTQPLIDQTENISLLSRYQQSWQHNYDAFAADSERNPNMSMEGLRNLVMSIRPPDAGRENWIKMGMICHHQSRGDLDGLDIWYDWSMQGNDLPDIYGEPASFSDMEYQWHTFKKNPSVGRSLATYRTLHYWANQNSPCDQSVFEDAKYDLDESIATEYVIDGFIGEGMFVLSGQSGIGKTTLLLPLAALAAHICADNHPLKPNLRRPVLYLTEDKKQAVRILSGLRKHCGAEMSATEMNQWFKIRETHRMNKDEVAKLIREFASENKVYMKDVDGNDVLIPVLIVADTVAASLDLEDENNNSEVSKFISSIKIACSDTGASLWLIAHISKVTNRAQVSDMSARGASAFGADANGTGFVIADEKGDSNKRYLILGKKRYETSFNEVAFTSEVYEIFAKNRLGAVVPECYRIGSIEKSSEQNRKEEAKQAQLSRDEAKVLDAMRQSGHVYFPKKLIGALMGTPSGSGYQKLCGVLTKLLADGQLELVAAEEARLAGALIAPNAKEIYRITVAEDFSV